MKNKGWKNNNWSFADMVKADKEFWEAAEKYAATMPIPQEILDSFTVVEKIPINLKFKDYKNNKLWEKICEES